MAKKTTNERRDDTEPPVTGYYENLEGKEPATEDKKAAPVDAEALNAQIKALSDQVSGLQDANYQLMSTPSAMAPANNPGPATELSIDDLPDPVTDPGRYSKALTDRIVAQNAASMAQDRAAAQSAAAETAKMDGLWGDFQDQYGEKGYSDDEKIGYAAYRVIGKARKRGVDVDKYAYQTQTKFFKDVIDEYDRTFGAPGGEPKVKEPEESGDRAVGMFGGSDPLTRPTPKAEKGDMFSDLTEIQKKLKLY